MRAELVRFHMFSARRTVDLKVQRVEMTQRLDLHLLLENLVITGRDVVLGTCTCTRVQLEYRFQVLVLVLVLEG